MTKKYKVKKQIFPPEIIDHSIEVHQFKHHNHSKIIYLVILSGVILILLLLPFVKVDVYVTARGILKSDQEWGTVTSRISGKVLVTNIKDNINITQGDTLLIIQKQFLEKESKLLENTYNENEAFIADCNYLLKSKKPNYKRLVTPKYQKELIYFQEKLRELYTILRQKKITKNRNQKLFDKQVISLVALEKSDYEYKLAYRQYTQLKKQKQQQWQIALNEYLRQKRELEKQKLHLISEREQLIVTAPQSGVLKNARGITSGTIITQGSILAQISPNTPMIAECYLHPKDIGMITKDDKVTLQVDAFHHHQWGLAQGSIQEIGKDIDRIEDQTVFKVRCKVAKPYLRLDNGFEGKLKKGMTLQARFLVAERTILDLLYDKITDWLAPNS